MKKQTLYLFGRMVVIFFVIFIVGYFVFNPKSNLKKPELVIKPLNPIEFNLPSTAKEVIEKLQAAGVKIQVGTETNYQTSKLPVRMDYIDEIDIAEAKFRYDEVAWNIR